MIRGDLDLVDIRYSLLRDGEQGADRPTKIRRQAVGLITWRREVHRMTGTKKPPGRAVRLCESNGRSNRGSLIASTRSIVNTVKLLRNSRTATGASVKNDYRIERRSKAASEHCVRKREICAV